MPVSLENLNRREIMKKIMIYGLVGGLLLFFGQCLQSDADSVAVPTSSKAIESAASFFKAVNWRADGDAEATYSAPDQRANAWRVKFKDITADVDDTTGQIHSAMNVIILERKNNGTVGISVEVANQNALQYLKAAGLSLDDARIVSSKYVRYSTSPVFAFWEIVLQRMYNGHPFYGDDFIRVTLDPADGSLSSFGYNFRSPLPESTSVQLSQESAVSAGQDYLAGLGYEVGSLVSADLQIVQPNSYWEYMGTGSLPPTPSESRLAWVISFNAPWKKTEVWVDAANGSVLGGVRNLSIPKTDVKLPGLSGVKSITVTRSASSDSKSVGNNLTSQILISGLQSCQAYAPNSTPSLILRCSGKSCDFTFGYYASDHVLMLMQKEHKGKVIEGNVAWDISKDLEALLAKYTK